jgi:hypothetical protein
MLKLRLLYQMTILCVDFLIKLKFKNSILQRMCNFAYYEIVEAGISVLAWKGCYDTLDIGLVEWLARFAESENRAKLFSIIVSLVLGYASFAIIVFVERLLVKLVKAKAIYSKFNFDTSQINQTHSMNVYYFLAYWSMIAIWRTFFFSYDFFVLEHKPKHLIVLLTHLGTFAFMYSIGMVSTLIGPANCDLGDLSNEDQEEAEKFPETNLYDEINFNRFLTIEYFKAK